MAERKKIALKPRKALSPPLALALLALLGGLAAARSPDPFRSAPFDGSKRLVLVFAADASDPRLAEERAQLQALTGAPDDRDLVVIEVLGDAANPPLASALALRRRFKPPEGAFSVLLIGKDGGVKIRSTHPISAGALGETIDAMPMRRGERLKSGAGGS